MVKLNLKYKNISKQKLEVIGVGVVEAGATIEVAEVVENPNLELVEDSRKITAVESTPKKPK